MEPWAQRIQSRLDDLRDTGVSESGLARRCKIARASVSGWFGKGAKPTKMISGDNLVAAAAYLNTTPEWIMTGHGPLAASQSVRLTGSMILDAYREAARAITLMGQSPEDFDPMADLHDAEILSRALLDLISRSGGAEHALPETTG